MVVSVLIQRKPQGALGEGKAEGLTEGYIQGEAKGKQQIIILLHKQSRELPLLQLL
jgi:flagellar biosynthesis/type III secretory pathway protein FliH